ncbi:MAG TPA: type II secretion system F family protein [Candidatus Omnitrophota bacterium]|nr:type II secretion system F family protein [Candidatus Omnitrophota bacterium]HPS37420.1 type II secretion system F family protein [Candidatus Omnitrophota bacterium]
MEASFLYKARDNFGNVTEGKMTADSDLDVSAKLRQQGMTPVWIRPEGADLSTEFLLKFRRLKIADINAFTREFYTLIKAGLTAIASLEVISEQDRNPVLKRMVDGLITSIRGGASISDSLARYPKIFTPLYVNMFRAGETSGRIEEILERLMYLGEAEEKLRLRVKSALRYPTIVLSAIVLAFLALTNFIIPRFAKLFAQSNVELPLPTRILLGIHDVMQHYGVFIAIGAVAAGILIVRFAQTPSGKLLFDRVWLKVPVLGPLILKAEMSRFARVMAILLQSGIAALKALEIAYGSADNRVVAGAIEKIRVSVTEGTGMTQPMKESGIFPPSVVRMVRVGEETGKIDELLLKVSDYYDMQVDYIVSNLMVLIEPMLIVILGLMVLVLALGMFLPMWNMISLFRR